jgi:hypothetical protein
VKLWLDDVRPAPDWSWACVRTVEDAMFAFEHLPIEVASLDHDLGYIADPNWDGDPREPRELDPEEYFIARSRPGGDGIDLVRWMCEHGHFPSLLVVIHSWNPDGARNMYEALKAAKCPVPVVVRPFELPESVEAKRYKQAMNWPAGDPA